MSESPDERPHDILSADEYGMPAPDPSLHVEPVHDVLAAEEFSMGEADPTLRRDPVTLPEEPYPAAQAHDVLAAEEFAMPAGRQVAVTDESGRGVGRMAAAAALGAGAVAGAFAALRRRSRR